MDHTVLIDNIFRDAGLRICAEWNCFQPPYDAAHGWPLRLPQPDWSSCDYVVLIFQDFITMRDGVCVELQQVEEFYGDRAHQVIVLHWPHELGDYYSGPLQLVEFNVHEYMILNNLAQRRESWQINFGTTKRRGWQCLNGRRCPHRLAVVQYLEQNWSGGVISYGTVRPLQSWPYSTYRGTSNEDNWIRLLPIYQQHQFNIVTETQYDQTPGIISEKTTFALLAGQIPIVIGYPGIVRDCQELGFDMFTDIIDTSYDFLPDDQRWQAALDLNQSAVMNFDTNPNARKQVREKFEQVQQRLQHQSEWLLDKWPAQHARDMQLRLQRIIALRDQR